MPKSGATIPYNQCMRRVLQLGFLLLLLASFLVPVAEFFDRWDAPGLSNDTDFPLFLVVLFICLTLLVAKLISLRALSLRFVASLVRLPVASLFGKAAASVPSQLISSHTSPPLRI